ncbi:MAG: patatin-like phospholipase family protein, partial [Thalassolituus sp.]
MEVKKTGLILSGGGARAAYQVGVLKAIHKILPKGHYNPFDIISGTSAGAINGVGLASYAE